MMKPEDYISDVIKNLQEGEWYLGNHAGAEDWLCVRLWKAGCWNTTDRPFCVDDHAFSPICLMKTIKQGEQMIVDVRAETREREDKCGAHVLGRSLERHEVRKIAAELQELIKNWDEGGDTWMISCTSVE